MAIYTKTGDDGTTSLAGGTRVSKDDSRVETYGTIDELNSFVGLLCSLTNDSFLQEVQRKLFAVGGYFAYEEAKTSGVTDDDVKAIETEIDRIQESLEPLHCFILPGGTIAASVCHVCRTVCRRAERCMMRFQHMEDIKIDAHVMQYLNRLSDYFFVLARYLNNEKRVEDILL